MFHIEDFFYFVYPARYMLFKAHLSLKWLSKLKENRINLEQLWRGNLPKSGSQNNALDV